LYSSLHEDIRGKQGFISGFHVHNSPGFWDQSVLEQFRWLPDRGRRRNYAEGLNGATGSEKKDKRYIEKLVVPVVQAGKVEIEANCL
jgi:hypothetical protein